MTPRKGTFSCLECKRRKRKCQPDPSGPCKSCRRLGTSCQSQHHNEELQQRLCRIESLVDELQKSRALCHSTHPTQGSSIPCFGTSLAAHLRSILPSPRTIARIIKLGQSPFQSFRSNNVPDLQSIIVHPIRFASLLLQLAVCLRQLACRPHSLSALQLKVDPRRVSGRFADVAMHITVQDRLVQSQHGLETLLLQGCYEVYAGHARKSWEQFHRACLLWSRQSIPTSSYSNQASAQSLQTKLTYANRFASLVMGVPCAPVAEEPFDGANSSINDVYASAYLAQVHASLAGRIINRNVRIAAIWSAFDHHDHDLELLDLQVQLRHAASRISSEFWERPMISISAPFQEVTRGAERLNAQLHQHYLTLLLYQPYFLKTMVFSLAEAQPPIETSSVSVSLEASREMLSLARLYHSFDQVPESLAGLYHKVYIASITVLLIHIHFLYRKKVDVPETQKERLEDLSSIRAMQEHMTRLSTNEDASVGSCATIIGALLQTEETVQRGAEVTLRQCTGGETVERFVSFPYFGSIAVEVMERNWTSKNIATEAGVDPDWNCFNQPLWNDINVDLSELWAGNFIAIPES